MKATTANDRIEFQTLSDRIRSCLEDDIVAGRLGPGDRLSEQALADRFNVSRTPIREALRQLSSAGWVKMRPHQGAIVSPMPIQRMVEMFQVMAELEGLCARLAARRMTDRERRALETIHRRCAAALKRGNPESYYWMNTKFHEAVYAGSHNQFLEETTRSIRNRLTCYRRYQLHQPGRLVHSFSEHEAIFEAIVAGDADAAQRLMHRHVSVQGEVFADLISALSAHTAAEARQG